MYPERARKPIQSHKTHLERNSSAKGCLKWFYGEPDFTQAELVFRTWLAEKVIDRFLEIRQ